MTATVAAPVTAGNDVRTRDRVSDLLLEHGALTAAELAERLGLSSGAVRRHLDALTADGRVDERDLPTGPKRLRGRPARRYVLTEHGRAGYPHAYDDLALAALRHIALTQGDDAVLRFAADRVAGLEERCREAMDDAEDTPLGRTGALADALTREGYAASASALSMGGQLCQHHCPVAHVAAEFPELCDAETRVIGRLVGSHVQRLATIAHGDGVCTTYIPAIPAEVLRRSARSPRDVVGAATRTTAHRTVPDLIPPDRTSSERTSR